MRCRHLILRSARLAVATVAGSLALAACTSTGDATPLEESPAAEGNEPSEPVTEPEPSSSVSESPTDEEAVVASYERFLAALVQAMESGEFEHPELAERASGPGLVSAQAMVISLAESGRIARGEMVPAIEAIEVEGDTASLVDCVGLDLVEYDAETDEQVADRGGARFRVTAGLQRDGDDWILDEFAQGDACAPEAVGEAVLDGYLGFWDAVWSAAEPPDPDHPGLAATAGGSQLDWIRIDLTTMRDEGLVRRGRGTEHPVVVHVTDHDTQAFVRDCVEEDPDGGTFDAATGELVAGGTAPGQRTLLESRLAIIEDTWRVVHVTVLEEDSACVPDGS